MATVNRIAVLSAVLASAILGTPALAAPVSGQGTWETTLQARDLDGNAATAEAYYDTVLNITWQANANLALTEKYGQGPFMTGDGRMERPNAAAWLAGMNAAGYLGFSDWRFPATFDPGIPGCNYPRFPLPYAGYPDQDCGYNVNPATSEMAHLYYMTLGNESLYDTSGNYTNCINILPNYQCMTNKGPFTNLFNASYLSGTQVAGAENVNFLFDFIFGVQDAAGGSYNINVWAVHDGDIGSPVPIPPAVWLFGSALGVMGVMRRKISVRFPASDSSAS